MTNFSDLVGLTEKDLLKKRKEIRTNLFEARMKNSMGQLANPMEIRVMRKDVARINTALTQASEKNQARVGRKG